MAPIVAYTQEMTPLDTRPLVERITDELRAQVIDGRLKPGSRLRQEEIAAELGISRTPLREAFRRLQGEGWFLNHPRQGIVVSSLSIEEVTNIAVARMMLEPTSARLAAVTHDQAAEDRMRALIAKHPVPEDAHAFFEINRDFHFEVSGIGGPDTESTDLSRIIARYWEQFSRYRLYYWRSTDHVALSTHAHNQIADAWLARDGDKVEKLVAQHIWVAIKDQIAVLHPEAEVDAALRTLCSRYDIEV